MPVSYNIDHAHKRIYSRATGTISFQDLRDHIKEDIGEAASYPELLDCTGATTDIGPDDVRKLAAEREKTAISHPPGPVAVVATNDVVFGMLRMFDILTSQIRPLRVFRDRPRAEQWLDAVARGESPDK
jgi:hypothetical protein